MDEGRANYLESLPTGIAFDPCKCPSCKEGYTFNEERQMWVCAQCNKPSGGHRGYSPWCYECGQPFTYPVAIKEKYPFCPECE